jgi:hypothetical protein
MARGLEEVLQAQVALTWRTVNRSRSNVLQVQQRLLIKLISDRLLHLWPRRHTTSHRRVHRTPDAAEQT